GPPVRARTGHRQWPGSLSARPATKTWREPLFFRGSIPIRVGMERLGGLVDRIALAMAGKRSPWGKPSPDGGDQGNEQGGEGRPSSEDAPKGPRNPWLPGGGGEPPRRSAKIEDIFRQRGPEGPRRGSGPGGPGFRFPQRPGGKSWFPFAIAALAVVWLGFSMIHQV